MKKPNLIVRFLAWALRPVILEVLERRVVTLTITDPGKNFGAPR